MTLWKELEESASTEDSGPMSEALGPIGLDRIANTADEIENAVKTLRTRLSQVGVKGDEDWVRKAAKDEFRRILSAVKPVMHRLGESVDDDQSGSVE